MVTESSTAGSDSDNLVICDYSSIMDLYELIYVLICYPAINFRYVLFKNDTKSETCKQKNRN